LKTEQLGDEKIGKKKGKDLSAQKEPNGLEENIKISKRKGNSPPKLNKEKVKFKSKDGNDVLLEGKNKGGGGKGYSPKKNVSRGRLKKTKVAITWIVRMESNYGTNSQQIREEGGRKPLGRRPLRSDSCN